MEALQEIDNILCPQLEYLMNGWDPAIVQQFIDRYNQSHVGHKEKLTEYLNDQPIQKVLAVYRLDPEKFWYFLLFAVDFTEGLGYFFTPTPTPLEQFEKVFPLIEANLQPYVFPSIEANLHPLVCPQVGYVFKDDPNMKLTLTVKKPGMKRSTVVDIDTPNALALLADIYRKADKSAPLFHRSVSGSLNKLDHPMAERLACFYKILMPFLQPLKAQKRVVDRYTSIDKGFLISQLANLMGLVIDPRKEISYSDIRMPRRLRDNVKDYMDVNIFGPNEHYNYDFLADN